MDAEHLAILVTLVVSLTGTGFTYWQTLRNERLRKIEVQADAANDVAEADATTLRTNREIYDEVMDLQRRNLQLHTELTKVKFQLNEVETLKGLVAQERTLRIQMESELDQYKQQYEASRAENEQLRQQISYMQGRIDDLEKRIRENSQELKGEHT